MCNVEIRRPRIEDIEELNQFFRTTIQDTFAKEGLSELLDDIEKEIQTKKNYLQCDFDSEGEKRYFLIAVDTNRNQIIGTIEYGAVSELIVSCTDIKDIHEVGTVFVHPDNQRRGIGNLLLNVMFLTLLGKGISEFCLDSGYKNAQKIWSMFHDSSSDEFLIFQAKKELNLFTEQDMEKEHYKRWMNFSQE